MKTLGRYDTELQMFVEGPREPRIARLRFLRWLAERTNLEHPVAGPPSGEYARAAGPAAGSTSTPGGSASSGPPVPTPASHRRGRDRAFNRQSGDRSGRATDPSTTWWADPAEQW
jgi:hypothetical protein